MSDFTDELAAKRAAIAAARNSDKPALSSEKVLALLESDLTRVQTVIDNMTHSDRCAG